MKVYFVGLGKLGLPVALALEKAGHEVAGWDISEVRREQITRRLVPEAAHEPYVHEYLAESKLRVTPLDDEDPHIILIAVQTPHEPEFEGCVPLSRPAQDFSYAALQYAVTQVAGSVRQRGTDPLVVVISTCLPGTFDRMLRFVFRGFPEQRPLRFVYHPLFIAMGQVIDDFYHPEFVLVGTDKQIGCDHELWRLYDSMPTTHSAPIRQMSITSAELTKVAYNAWLGYKLMLANGLAELADNVGANVDDVLGALKLATNRLVSTKYMTAGMGDGGGCHPRDQIALSYIAKEVGLSHDTFEVVIRAREGHARWLADLWCDEADRTGLPLVMLGSAYKPNSTLQTGSAARLVLHYARVRGREPEVWDSGAVDRDRCEACYFLATPHDWTLTHPLSGVLVDPWGLRDEHAGLRIIRPGRREATLG